MKANYDRWLTDTGTYWPPGVNDGFGGTTAGPPEPVAIRWEDKTVLYRDSSGNEVTSSAVVFVDRPLELEGSIAKGDETGSSDPTSEARQIRQVQTSPSLDGSTQITKVIL